MTFPETVTGFWAKETVPAMRRAEIIPTNFVISVFIGNMLMY